MSRSSYRTLLLTVWILATIGLSTEVLYSVRLYLFEQSECRSYYIRTDPSAINSDGSVDEAKCKTNAVQSEAIQLLGWFVTTSVLLSLPLVLIYGRLSEKLGRKSILIASSICVPMGMLSYSAVFYFHRLVPVKLIFATFVFDIFGGGVSVQYALLFAQLGIEAKRLQMRSIFYQAGLLLLATKFVGMTIGASLLSRGRPWVICIAATSVSMLGIPAALCLPSRTYTLLPDKEEQEPGQHDPLEEDFDSQSILSQHSFSSDSTLGQASAAELNALPIEPSLFIKNLSTAIPNFCSALIHHPLVLYSSLLYCFCIAGLSIRLIYQQWGSKELHWSLGEFNFIISYELLVSITVYIALPPLLRHLEHAWGHSKNIAEFRVIQLGLVARAVGVVGMSFATTMPAYAGWLTVFTLGIGALDGLRSLVTSLLKEEADINRLHLALTFADGAGSLAATPLIAKLSSLSMSSDFLPKTTPFYFSSALFGVALLCSLGIYRYLKPGSMSSLGGESDPP